MRFHARRTGALGVASSSVSSALPSRKSSASRFVSVLVPWRVFSAAFPTSATNARGSVEDRPGWKTLSCPPVAPEEARKILSVAAGLTTSPLPERQVVMAEGQTPFETTGGPATSETEATPEIQALARALQHDPKLIFDYVHNHIDYVPLFGSMQGGHGDAAGGRGNEWDQASPFIALTRESGYKANYAQYWICDLSANGGA